MTRALPWRIVLIAALLVVVFLAGCGGPKLVKVNGKLTQDSKPLQVSNKTLVTIMFAPVEQTGQTSPAKFDPEQGTYTVTIPTGKYRVNVVVVKEQNKPPINPPMDPNKTYEIVDDQEIDLEIGKK